MNMKQVWAAAGGFFFVFILITLTNKPRAANRDAAPTAPTQPPATEAANTSATSAPEAAAGGDKVRGFTLLPPDGSRYNTAGLPDALREIAAAGGGWVALAPRMFQARAATERLPVPNVEAVGDVRDAVRAAKAAGVKVFLRPVVAGEDGTRSDALTPPDAGKWLTSYGEAMGPWLKLAEEEGVEIVAIGSKLGKLQEDAGWGEVIADARALYKGKLTYAAAADAATGYGQVAFWRELDYVGIDGHFPLTDAIGPQAKDLEAGWTKAADGLEGWRPSGGADKPILLTSAGVPHLNGAAADPGAPDPSKAEDSRLQAEASAAFFKTMWTKPWVAGVFWHTWSGFTDRQNPYAFDGQPALDVVKIHFTAQ